MTIHPGEPNASKALEGNPETNKPSSGALGPSPMSSWKPIASAEHLKAAFLADPEGRTTAKVLLYWPNYRYGPTDKPGPVVTLGFFKLNPRIEGFHAKGLHPELWSSYWSHTIDRDDYGLATAEGAPTKWAIVHEPGHPVFETIAAVAIQWNGVVLVDPAPARHYHLIRRLADTNEPALADAAVEGEQGFVTSMGRFVDRKVAFDIAKWAGQMVQETAPSEGLFSEDMW